MKKLSQVNAGQYYPTEIARDITNAYSRLGMAQGMLQNKREQEEQEKKERRKQLRTMGIMLGAAALTGGAAALAAPGALAAAGGGVLGGLKTFGSGALGAFTGGGPAVGASGLAGALNTGAGVLGRVGTNMLTSGGSDGGGGVEDAAMGALGSYFKDSQAANKTSRILEGTLKDPTVRATLYPGVEQDQVDAILKYKQDNYGTIEGAQFLQQALPMLSRTSAGNVDFDRQLKMQNLRSEPIYARGLAELASSRGGGGGVVLPPVQEEEPADFTLFGGVRARPRETQDFSGEWRGIPYRAPGQ